MALCVTAVIATGCWFWFVDKPGINERVMFWEKLLAAYKSVKPKFWVTGFGIGRWKEVYPQLIESKLLPNGYVRIHNTVIQNYTEMGITWIVIFIGYLVSMFRKINHKKHHIHVMGIIAVFVCSMSNSMFRMNAINAFIAITWLALLQKEVRHENIVSRGTRTAKVSC